MGRSDAPKPTLMEPARASQRATAEQCEADGETGVGATKLKHGNCVYRLNRVLKNT